MPASRACSRLRSCVCSDGSRPTACSTRRAISQRIRPEPLPTSSTRAPGRSQGAASASTRSRYSSTSASRNGRPVRRLTKPPAVTLSAARSATKSKRERMAAVSSASGSGSAVSTLRHTASPRRGRRQRSLSTAASVDRPQRITGAPVPARIVSTRSAGQAASRGT